MGLAACSVKKGLRQKKAMLCLSAAGQELHLIIT